MLTTVRRDWTNLSSMEIKRKVNKSYICVEIKLVTSHNGVCLYLGTNNTTLDALCLRKVY